MENELTLRGALGVVRRRWLTVLLTVTVVVAAAVALTLAQTRRYEATAVLIAGQGQGIAGIDSVLQVNQATQSLGDLITDRVVVEDAAREAGYTGDIDTLLQHVSATVPANTQAIELTVNDTDRRRAARIANAVAQRFSELIEAKASKDSTLSAVVWQPAVAPKVDNPASPNRTRTVALAFVLSFLFGLGLAFVREHLDASWRSEADVERALDLPVLGGVPDVGRRPARRTVYG